MRGRGGNMLVLGRTEGGCGRGVITARPCNFWERGRGHCGSEACRKLHILPCTHVGLVPASCACFMCPLPRLLHCTSASRQAGLNGPKCCAPVHLRAEPWREKDAAVAVAVATREEEEKGNAMKVRAGRQAPAGKGKGGEPHAAPSYARALRQK